MSGAALAWAKSVTAPSRTAKAVLVCLADYADADGCAWPAIRRLMGEVQCSQSTIQRALRSLEEVGLVNRRRHERQDGGETSARYTLAMAARPPSQNDTPPVSKCDPPGVTGATPPVSPVTPPYEPPLEPPLELLGSDEPRRRSAPPLPGFEEAWKAYPHVRGRSSKAKALAEWRKLPPLTQAGLAAACRRYGEDGREPKADCGAPAMERWLKAGRFEDWLTTGSTGASPPATEERSPWPMRLRRWAEDRYWDADWGPRPGRDGCLAPTAAEVIPMRRQA